MQYQTFPLGDIQGLLMSIYCLSILNYTFHFFFKYIYEVDILFRNSLGSNFNIWFESLKHIKTYV